MNGSGSSVEQTFVGEKRVTSPKTSAQEASIILAGSG